MADSLVNIDSSAAIRAIFTFIDASDAVMGVLIGEVAEGSRREWRSVA